MSMSPRQLATAVGLGLVVTALFWIDPLFIPLALLAPPLTGVLAAMRRQPLAWPVLAWLVAGVGAVVSDWIVNREDVGFHIVLTILVVVLAAAGWAIARKFGRSTDAAAVG